MLLTQKEKTLWDRAEDEGSGSVCIEKGTGDGDGKQL